MLPVGHYFYDSTLLVTSFRDCSPALPSLPELLCWSGEGRGGEGTSNNRLQSLWAYGLMGEIIVCGASRHKARQGNNRLWSPKAYAQRGPIGKQAIAFYSGLTYRF